MNILIAPDAFKDCLSARQVAMALTDGLKALLPASTFELVPMADGGEGTVESIIDATGGKRITVTVKDPLLREINSFYGITGDGNTAIIEMAAASGLELLDERERDPWVTSSYGTGQLIRDALDHGCRKILLGIGGSATNDCGAGMAGALGVKFFKSDGTTCGQGGGELDKVDRISMREIIQGFQRPNFWWHVMCQIR